MCGRHDFKLPVVEPDQASPSGRPWVKSTADARLRAVGPGSGPVRFDRICDDTGSPASSPQLPLRPSGTRRRSGGIGPDGWSVDKHV